MGHNTPIIGGGLGLLAAPLSLIGTAAAAVGGAAGIASVVDPIGLGGIGTGAAVAGGAAAKKALTPPTINPIVPGAPPNPSDPSINAAALEARQARGRAATYYSYGSTSQSTNRFSRSLLPS